MRSKRTDRKELKSRIQDLEEQIARLTAQPESKPAEKQIDEAVAAAPKIASRGYPLRSQPQQPKTLKEAKELLLSLREW